METNEGLTRLRAKKVVIGTGSRPILPGPFVGHDRGVFTTDDLFDIAAIPGSLLIVGAGAIGVEMASIMAGLGSMVTLLGNGEDDSSPGRQGNVCVSHTDVEKTQRKDHHRYFSNRGCLRAKK